MPSVKEIIAQKRAEALAKTTHEAAIPGFDGALVGVYGAPSEDFANLMIQNADEDGDTTMDADMMISALADCATRIVARLETDEVVANVYDEQLAEFLDLPFEDPKQLVRSVFSDESGRLNGMWLIAHAGEVIAAVTQADVETNLEQS